MIQLKNKENTTPPDYDYPFGDMKDDTNAGLDDGNRMNRNFHSDYVQFFEKMFSDSGILANGLPDNDYTGFQLYEAFQRLTRSYAVYEATLTQESTDDPIVTELGYNQIGSIAWTRTGMGEYTGTLAGAFINAPKLCFYIQTTGLWNRKFIFGRTGDDTIILRTVNSTTGAGLDDLLINTSILIKIYP